MKKIIIGLFVLSFLVLGGLKVEATTSGCVSGEPSITVLSPNGGETLVPGQQIEVKWRGCDISSNNSRVTISFYVSETGQHYFLAGPHSNFTKNDGKENFIVPTTIPTGKYTIAVSADEPYTGLPTVIDYSDSKFLVNSTERVDCNVVPMKTVFDRELGVGSRGEDVRELQKLLKEKKFLTINSTTDYYGKLTEEAVKKYQKELNFSITTGAVKENTLEALKREKMISSNTASADTVSSGQVVPSQTVANPNCNDVVSNNYDKTPRIMYWYGKVNQHIDVNTGKWLTDPDGVSGANLDKLTYCRKWFPKTTRVEDYKIETINSWHDRGNVSKYLSTKMSTKCVEGTTSTTPVISGVSGHQALNVNQVGTWTVLASTPNTVLGETLWYSVNWGDVGICPVSAENGPCPVSMGTVQQSAMFTHSYLKAGTYKPIFTVTNGNGKSATASLSIKVGEVIPTSAITVLSPKVGNLYSAGQKITIKWTPGLPGLTYVNFYKSDSTYSTPARVLINPDTSGSMSYTFPSDMPVGKYKIYAFYESIQNGVSTSKKLFESDGYFTINSSTPIPNSSITVLSPNGGETFYKNAKKEQTISWKDEVKDTSMAKKYYDITLESYRSPFTCSRCSLRPELAPITIAEKVSGLSYEWQVRDALIVKANEVNIPDGQYTIKVCRTGTDICDSSDSYFKIFTSENQNIIDNTKTYPNSQIYGQVESVNMSAMNKNRNTVAFDFNRELKLGVKGEDVRKIQEFLKEKGFLVINSPTEYYGNLTQEAVRKYQEQNKIGLKKGEIDVFTLNKIVEEIQKSY